MTWAVRFEDVSKRYRRGGQQYASLRDDVARAGRRIAAFFRGRAAEEAGLLALSHVSFEVPQGEAFAIVGPNGAGKTTALKMLTRISFPTCGRIHVRGRVGALIEVGSGIHPELSGRENVWLYGRIMGMSRRDIARRFDQIVDFAELGDVLDMPVKRYSTGMQLRLGFAVASHLDPDVFVVDEALAVGDAGFQAKCVDRMMSLVSEGRTLLLVSHWLPAVEALCRRAMFVRDGRIETIGETRDVLRTYLRWTEERALERARSGQLPRAEGAGVDVVAATCHGADGRERYAFTSEEPVEIRVRLRARHPLTRPHINLGITDGRPGVLVGCSTMHRSAPPDHVRFEWIAACRFERLHLMPRLYHVWCDVYTEHGHGALARWLEVAAFRIVATEEQTIAADRGAHLLAVSTEALGGPVRSEYRWSHTVN